jgi:hypothetical protein
MSENLTPSFEGLICPRSKAALAPVDGVARTFGLLDSYGGSIVFASEK